MKDAVNETGWNDEDVVSAVPRTFAIWLCKSWWGLWHASGLGASVQAMVRAGRDSQDELWRLGLDEHDKRLHGMFVVPFPAEDDFFIWPENAESKDAKDQ